MPGPGPSAADTEVNKTDPPPVLIELKDRQSNELVQ